MNKVLSLFYRFRPIRLWWWKRKKQLNHDFNDRERLQEIIDLGYQKINLPSGIIKIDHTIYLGSETHLLGSGYKSEFTTKGEEKENAT